MVPNEVSTVKPQFTGQQIAKLPSYVISGLRYHIAGVFYTPKPTHSSLRVTRQCNSRCVMCQDWARPAGAPELTLAEIKKIYDSPLFSSLQRIGFSGGEPTLRTDLAQIAEIILSSCPRITEIRLGTNGLDPDATIQRVEELLDTGQRKKIRQCIVAVSLDGYGPVHQEIRGVPQAFERVSETLRHLKRLQNKRPFFLSLTCVVQRRNFEQLVPLAEFASSLKLPLTFVPARVNASSVVEQNTSPEITREQIKYLSEIFDGRLRHYLTPSNFLFWQQYFAMHRDETIKRSLPCYLLRHFAEIDTDGTLRVCVQRNSLDCGNVWDELPHEIWYSDKMKKLRKVAEKSTCSKCTDCCDVDTSLRMEFFFFAGCWLKERIRELDFRRSK